MDEKRIYGKKEDINSEKVKIFYEKRFTSENPLASVMVRGDSNDNVAEKSCGLKMDSG